MQKNDWLQGTKFGRLTLTGESQTKGKHRFVETICECGTLKWIRFDGIKSGAVSSCGCWHSESAKKQLTTHGLSYHPLYNTHEDMKARCYNEKAESYCDYGARGIIVEDVWKNDFKAFYDWAIDQGWVKGWGLTLDRINNDGNYGPGNCRFSTNHIQSRNKRSNRLVTLFGETKCIADWGLDKRCKVPSHTFSTRIKRGWDVEKALIMPSLIPENNPKYKIKKFYGNKQR